MRKITSAGWVLHADDTPVPVLAPGTGKTKLGRLWTYVRDDRPAGDSAAPAVWFAYSPDRKGEHPHRHLAAFAGTLQADGYAGFNRLYDSGRIREAELTWYISCDQVYPQPNYFIDAPAIDPVM